MSTNEISLEQLAQVTGGAGWGNTMRAGAVAGMNLVAGDEGPKFTPISPMGQTQSSSGSAVRAPFQPLSIPGGGTATFGQ